MKTLYLVTRALDPGPQAHRADAMVRAMEASTERLRDNLRRPHASGGDQPMRTATYTGNSIVRAYVSHGKHFAGTLAESPRALDLAAKALDQVDVIHAYCAGTDP